VDLGATDWKAQTDADVVRGLVFSALVARPDAAGEEKRKRLASLHASLRNEEARGLRFWEMRDLSMQLALDCASHHDPLRRLADVTCNLPAHTARLARLPVPAEFRDMFEQVRCRSAAGPRRALTPPTCRPRRPGSPRARGCSWTAGCCPGARPAATTWPPACRRSRSGSRWTPPRRGCR
jgi:hypothetical protein